jgi:hypothetical protein
MAAATARNFRAAAPAEQTFRAFSLTFPSPFVHNKTKVRVAIAVC